MANDNPLYTVAIAFGSPHVGSQALLLEVKTAYAEVLHSFIHGIFAFPDFLEHSLSIFTML